MKSDGSNEKSGSLCDSGISNENHCQSYLSEHLSTLKKKSLYPKFLLSSGESARDTELLEELQRKNSELIATISRYNTDLDEGFFEKIALKKRISELETHLNESNLELEQFKASLFKESRDVILQTDFIRNSLPKCLESANVSPNSLKEQQQSRTPENWDKFLEYNSVKHFFVGEKEGNRTASVSPKRSPNEASDKGGSGTPQNELDCEYFVSKRHIEKMMGNIATRVTKLRDSIKKSYPQILTPDSVVVSLNELSEQIRFLRVLIDDQLIEIRKFAEEIQDQQAHQQYISVASQATHPIIDLFKQEQSKSYTFHEKVSHPASVQNLVSPFKPTIEPSTDSLVRTTDDRYISQTSIYNANINQQHECSGTTKITQECPNLIIQKGKDSFAHPINNQTMSSNAEESQQYSVNLLDTLADDEFDLDSLKISKLTNSPFNSNSNSKRFHRTTYESRKTNEIVAFSFGNNLPISMLKLQEDQFLESHKQKIVQEYENKVQQYELFFESLRSAVPITNTSEHQRKSNEEILSIVLLRLKRFHCKQHEQLFVYFLQIIKIYLIESLEIQESVTKIEKRCKEFGKDSMNSTYSLNPSFEITHLKKQLQSQLLYILNQKNLNILTIKNNMENIKRVLGKENEEISIQYEQYGIVSAEVVFIMMYCKNLLQFFDQINQNIFENACTDIMDKLNTDIDALQISKRMKLFTEILKMSVEYHFLLRRSQID